MNIRKWLGLFTKTLILGGIVCLVTSFIVSGGDYLDSIKAGEWLNLIGLVLWYTIYGFLFSVVSQTGFFAYMFINQFGLSLFRSFWPTTQLLIVAFVVFDLIYFPYIGTDGEIALYIFILISFAILIYSIIIAHIKAKQTHKRAFVPSLFFMVVLTAIEWVPGLRTGEVDHATLMIITLLACNTYQLLKLHHLTAANNDKEQANVSNGPKKMDVAKSN